MSFLSIFYDSYKNKLYHRYINPETNKTKTDIISPKYEYYIQDRTNQSEMKDIFGNSVVKKQAKNRDGLKSILQSGITTYETDIPTEIKFLNDIYGKDNLQLDMSRFNVCNIDIETSTNGVFSSPEKADCPVNAITIKNSKGTIYTFGLYEYTGDSELVKNYLYCPDEKKLLEKFLAFFRSQKFDVITGWFCLSKNSTVWLNNEIKYISDVEVGESTAYNGNVLNQVYTGQKEIYEIILVDGTKIKSSSEHIIPYYNKNKKQYKNMNSLLSTYEENNTKYLYDNINDTDFYVEQNIHNNVNNNLKYNDIFIVNEYNIVLQDIDNIDLCKKKIIEDDTIPNHIRYRSPNQAPRWYNTNFIELTQDQLNLEMSYDTISYIPINHKRQNSIKIMDDIPLPLLYVLGIIYTDGSYWAKGNEFCIYNQDLGILNEVNRILVEYGIFSSPQKLVWNNACYRIRFGDVTNIFNLLKILIYKNNKKNLDLNLLSKLSKEQFSAFFSGCVDGDGWVNDTAVELCNYEHHDIEIIDIDKIHELMKWNGVFTTKTKHRLSVTNNDINISFISRLQLFNTKKKLKLSNLGIRDKKNSISKKIKWFDDSKNDRILLRIKKIVKTCEYVDMYDIETENSYFHTNGIKVHNCKGFDIPYLVNRMEKFDIDYTKLSPYNIVNKKRGDEEYTIAGISTLDYLELYKRFTFTDRESYSLDFIGNYEGVGGKLAYEGTISEIWKTNWNTWIEYNVQDVLVVDALDKKLRFIEQAIAISYDSLIPFEQVFSTLPMHIGYCLKFLHNKNMVMPVKGDVQRQSYPGGYVFRTLGMHDYVVSFDVTSLYPTLIRQFNIGPETLVKDPIDTEGLIKTPVSEHKKWVTSTKTYDDIGGIYYKKDKKSILVEIVESIFFGRIKDKEKKTICDLIDEGLTDDEICTKLSMMNVDLDNIKEEIELEEGKTQFYSSRQQVRKIQMNCFHENTDILTPSGIKKIKDIKVGDLVYSINKENQDLEIKNVEKTYEYDFDGELNRLKNTIGDIAVTEEHKMLHIIGRKNLKVETIKSKDFVQRDKNIVPIHNKLNNIYDEYTFLNEYVDMSNYNYYLTYNESDLRHVKKGISHINIQLKQCFSRKKTAFIISDITNKDIRDLYDLGYEVLVKNKRSIYIRNLQKCRVDTNNLSKLIGYYIAEGSLFTSTERKFKSVKRGVTKSISISQYRDINPKFYADIVDCFSDVLGNSLSCGYQAIKGSSDLLYEFIENHFGRLFEKKLYPLVDKLNKELVFKCMYNGDGHKSRRSYTISCKLPQLFEDTIRLVTELGFVPRYRIDSGCYRITWSHVNMHFKDKNKIYSKEKYIGKVYNLTVADNHTVCVGENGKFMWTGQSLYGALGTPYFNFYNIDNAIAVTLSGQTVIKYLSDNINKYLRMKYKLKSDCVKLIDTDSSYISFAEIIKNLGLEFKTNQDFLDWSYKFIDEIVEPFFVKILDIFAERYNTESLIKFNREKISRNMLILDGKKKYALNVLDNEGKVYDTPQVKVTGIEVVRTSTPVFCRNRLKTSLELIFETQNQDDLIDFIKKSKRDFSKQGAEDIAFPRGVSDYKKYAQSYKYYVKNGLSYPSGCPVANRASINYNYMIDKFNLKLQKVDDGTKIKFIYIKQDNMLNQNVIAFIGKYPDKFKELFEIDYKTQFEKSFQNVIQRFFDAMGWGEINFSAKKLSQFFN